jgi:hypothetical protein
MWIDNKYKNKVRLLILVEFEEKRFAETSR